MSTKPHLVDERVGFVISAGVVEHEEEVGHHIVQTIILTHCHPLVNPLHVDRLLDHLVVIRILLKFDDQFFRWGREICLPLR